MAMIPERTKREQQGEAIKADNQSGEVGQIIKSCPYFQSASPESEPDPARVNELSYNHEQKKMDRAEGLGGARYEKAVGRKLKKPDVEGADFLDPSVGSISLKGPLVNKKTGQPLPVNDPMVDGLAKSVVKDLKNNTATKRVVVDTAGLSPEQRDQLKQKIASEIPSGGPPKEIFFVE